MTSALCSHIAALVTVTVTVTVTVSPLTPSRLAGAVIRTLTTQSPPPQGPEARPRDPPRGLHSQAGSAQGARGRTSRTTRRWPIPIWLPWHHWAQHLGNHQQQSKNHRPTKSEVLNDLRQQYKMKQIHDLHLKAPCKSYFYLSVPRPRHL